MNLSWQHDMKAFPNSTVHYRNSIRTISTVRTTLAYVTSATYSRGYRIKWGMNSDHHTLCRTIYFQYDQLIVDILAASQVSHCLRNSVWFASPTERPISLSWLRILTFLPSGLSMEEQNNTTRYLGLVVLKSKF
jgi:hypothetical protein